MESFWEMEDDGSYSLRDDLIAEETSKLAYLKWESEGKPENKDLDFWLTAENEVLRKLCPTTNLDSE